MSDNKRVFKEKLTISAFFDPLFEVLLKVLLDFNAIAHNYVDGFFHPPWLGVHERFQKLGMNIDSWIKKLARFALQLVSR